MATVPADTEVAKSDKLVHRPLSPQELKQITAMVKQGANDREIGESIGRNPSVVRRAVIRFHLRPGAARAPKPKKVLKHTSAGRTRIAEAQRARWARVHKLQAQGKVKGQLTNVKVKSPKNFLLTSQVKPRKGQYHCPECGAPFSTRRFLGRHRSKHGIPAGSPSALARHAQKQRLLAPSASDGAIHIYRHADERFHCPLCDQTPYDSDSALRYHFKVEHPSEKYHLHINLEPNSDRKELSHGNSHQPTQQRALHRAAKAQWSAEGIAGFVFAHVLSFIEETCTGREGSKPEITQRVSELLHLEVSRESERQRNLGLLHHLPGMRG